MPAIRGIKHIVGVSSAIGCRRRKKAVNFTTLNGNAPFLTFTFKYRDPGESLCSFEIEGARCYC